ncbi:unnamed protein product [Adineta ricciae]|uniref:NAD(+)--protein-arginine ADP-ribosyltransferase n=1 Tax=Adineta ricciae TaxID=249248 RepID=A0A815X5I2_ADIRI|nr:unnamed protein product [Adineta ricciae]CAF1553070.1 unnamed protein product [Adineta ricciae]
MCSFIITQYWRNANGGYLQLCRASAIGPELLTRQSYTGESFPYGTFCLYKPYDNCDILCDLQFYAKRLVLAKNNINSMLDRLEVILCCFRVLFYDFLVHYDVIIIGLDRFEVSLEYCRAHFESSFSPLCDDIYIRFNLSELIFWCCRMHFENSLCLHYDAIVIWCSQFEPTFWCWQKHFKSNLFPHYVEIYVVNDSNLVRDFILSRLPISSRSQAIAFSTLSTLWSQGQYGRRESFETFSRNYQPRFALKYYTQDSDFHRIINRTLRQDSIERIYHIRAVISHTIDCLRQSSLSEEDSVMLTLFRGQQITVFELDKLRRCKGEVVSIRSFFSTTFSASVADIFSGNGAIKDRYMVSVRFKIYLDTSQSMRPYRLITESAEDEVLLSPGTKFVLKSCRKLHDNPRSWLIKMVAIPEKQQEQLRLTYGETFFYGQRPVVVVRF